MLTNAKLTEDQAREIYRRAHQNRERLRDLADEFNVGYGTVQRLYATETWGWATKEVAHG
jgi:hypothetical protein